MTRRSLLSSLFALLLPKPPERYLFRLASVDVADDFWTRRVIYGVKQSWAFRSGHVSWAQR